jgi:hypothetical protein
LPEGYTSGNLQERIASFRKLGKEYLNVQFGWRPFIDDLLSSVRAARKHTSLLKQMIRDSGLPVRRAYYFPDVVTTSVGTSYAGLNLFDPGIGPSFSGADGRSTYMVGGNTGKLTDVSYTTLKAWFKGSFVYYFPQGNSLLDRVFETEAKAEYLTGAEMTPELLWQLAPWSWLGGWFSDIGQVINSASNFSNDNLVLRYGYLMTEYTTRRELVQTGGLMNLTGTSYPSVPFECSAVYTTRSKERFRATPYGFGADTSKFSDFQWSILGALGLTKAPHILH